MTKPPVAPEVMTDDLGPACAICLEPVYIDKIERGTRIGTRIRYRHVSMRPQCQGPLGAIMRNLYEARASRS